jgi:uncharacterized protein YlzI (FlbEa/FlbD family)
MSDIRITCTNGRTLILNSAMLESMEWNEITYTIKFKGAKEYNVTCRSIVELYVYPVEVSVFTDLVYKLFDVKL